MLKDKMQKLLSNLFFDRLQETTYNFSDLSFLSLYSCICFAFHNLIFPPCSLYQYSTALIVHTIKNNKKCNRALEKYVCFLCSSGQVCQEQSPAQLPSRSSGACQRNGSIEGRVHFRKFTSRKQQRGIAQIFYQKETFCQAKFSIG